jgi:hypothetical protein
MQRTRSRFNRHSARIGCPRMPAIEAQMTFFRQSSTADATETSWHPGPKSYRLVNPFHRFKAQRPIKLFLIQCQNFCDLHFSS